MDDYVIAAHVAFAEEQVPTFYELTHKFNKEPSKYFFSLKLPANALCILIVYIEQVAFDFQYKSNRYQHTLTEDEIIELIRKFYYEVTILSAAPDTYNEIDIYVNWEELGHLNLAEMFPELHRDELYSYIEKMAIQNNWAGV